MTPIYRLLPQAASPSLITDPRPKGHGGDWTTAYDVIGNPELQLVLPARQTIVHNRFSERLTEAASKFLYKTVRRLRPTAVVGYQTWKKARAAGFMFPEPAPRLEEWRPSTNSGEDLRNLAPPAKRDIGPEAMLFLPPGEPEAVDVEAGDSLPLYHALKPNGATNVFQPHVKWAGYDWYDKISKITRVRIVAKTGDETIDVTSVRGSNQEIGTHSRPDSITFEMTVMNASRQTETIRIPGEVAFSQVYSELEDEMPVVLLTKNSEISVDTLMEMIVDGFFQNSDDYEADSWETQLERFRSNARELAITILESPTEARKDSLICDLKQILQLRLTEGEQIVINQTANGLQIDFQPVEAGGKNAAGSGA